MGFQLVDRIVTLEPSRRILASRFISPDEHYFADHFPGYPVVPGVLQVEMMAQAAGKCLMAGIKSTLWPVLLQIRQATFRQSLRPGSNVTIEAVIESQNANTATAKGSLSVDGERVTEATLLFGFIARSLLKEGYEDPVLRSYLEEASRGRQIR